MRNHFLLYLGEEKRTDEALGPSQGRRKKKML